ncbi:hypothetical protein [Lysobacter gummosus]
MNRAAANRSGLFRGPLAQLIRAARPSRGCWPRRRPVLSSPWPAPWRFRC